MLPPVSNISNARAVKPRAGNNEAAGSERLSFFSVLRRTCASPSDTSGNACTSNDATSFKVSNAASKVAIAVRRASCNSAGSQASGRSARNVCAITSASCHGAGGASSANAPPVVCLSPPPKEGHGGRANDPFCGLDLPSSMLVTDIAQGFWQNRPAVEHDSSKSQRMRRRAHGKQTSDGFSDVLSDYSAVSDVLSDDSSFSRQTSVNERISEQRNGRGLSEVSTRETVSERLTASPFSSRSSNAGVSGSAASASRRPNRAYCSTEKTQRPATLAAVVNSPQGSPVAPVSSPDLLPFRIEPFVFSSGIFNGFFDSFADWSEGTARTSKPSKSTFAVSQRLLSFGLATTRIRFKGMEFRDRKAFVQHILEHLETFRRCGMILAEKSQLPDILGTTSRNRSHDNESLCVSGSALCPMAARFGGDEASFSRFAIDSAPSMGHARRQIENILLEQREAWKTAHADRWTSSKGCRSHVRQHMHRSVHSETEVSTSVLSSEHGSILQPMSPNLPSQSCAFSRPCSVSSHASSACGGRLLTDENLAAHNLEMQQLDEEGQSDSDCLSSRQKLMAISLNSGSSLGHRHSLPHPHPSKRPNAESAASQDTHSNSSGFSDSESKPLDAALAPEKLHDLINSLRAGEEEILNGEGEKVNVIAEATWTLLNAALLLEENERGITVSADMDATSRVEQLSVRTDVLKLQDMLIDFQVAKERKKEEDERKARERLEREEALLDLFRGLAADVQDSKVRSRVDRRFSDSVSGAGAKTSGGPGLPIKLPARQQQPKRGPLARRVQNETKSEAIRQIEANERSAFETTLQQKRASLALVEPQQQVLVENMVVEKLKTCPTYHLHQCSSQNEQQETRPLLTTGQVVSDTMKDLKLESLRKEYVALLEKIEVPRPKNREELMQFLEVNFPSGFDLLTEIQEKALAEQKMAEEKAAVAAQQRRGSAYGQLDGSTSDASASRPTGADVLLGRCSLKALPTGPTRRRSSSSQGTESAASMVSCDQNPILAATLTRFENMFVRARKLQVFHKILQARGVDPDTIRALQVLKWNSFENSTSPEPSRPAKSREDYLREVITEVVAQAERTKRGRRLKKGANASEEQGEGSCEKGGEP